jgi:hypothetical protein
MLIQLNAISNEGHICVRESSVGKILSICQHLIVPNYKMFGWTYVIVIRAFVSFFSFSFWLPRKCLKMAMWQPTVTSIMQTQPEGSKHG